MDIRYTFNGKRFYSQRELSSYLGVAHEYFCRFKKKNRLSVLECASYFLDRTIEERTKTSRHNARKCIVVQGIKFISIKQCIEYFNLNRNQVYRNQRIKKITVTESIEDILNENKVH